MVHKLLHESDPLPIPTERDADLIAISLHLSSARMLEGYRIGLFPWNDSDRELVKWWSPKVRGVFFPDGFHSSRSFQRFVRKTPLTTTFDSAFIAVVNKCSDRFSTWITPNMKSCYSELFEMGYAHSVEVWHAGGLVGGIFGISVGRVFIGESMFGSISNASKFALKVLLQRLNEWQFVVLDAQMPTDHLTSLGCMSMSRNEYLGLVDQNARQVATIPGKWTDIESSCPWEFLSEVDPTNCTRGS